MQQNVLLVSPSTLAFPPTTFLNICLACFSGRAASCEYFTAGFHFLVALSLPPNPCRQPTTSVRSIFFFLRAILMTLHQLPGQWCWPGPRLRPGWWPHWTGCRCSDAGPGQDWGQYDGHTDHPGGRVSPCLDKLTLGKVFTSDSK